MGYYKWIKDHSCHWQPCLPVLHARMQLHYSSQAISVSSRNPVCGSSGSNKAVMEEVIRPAKVKIKICICCSYCHILTLVGCHEHKYSSLQKKGGVKMRFSLKGLWVFPITSRLIINYRSVATLTLQNSLLNC